MYSDRRGDGQKPPRTKPSRQKAPDKTPGQKPSCKDMCMCACNTKNREGGPGFTIRNPTLVRRIMHINELTSRLCILMSIHVTIIILGKIADRRLNIIMLYHAF